MMNSLEENSGLTRKISSAPSRDDDALEFASPCFVFVGVTAPGTAPYANALLAHRAGCHVHPGREHVGGVRLWSQRSVCQDSSATAASPFPLAFWNESRHYSTTAFYFSFGTLELKGGIL